MLFGLLYLSAAVLRLESQDAALANEYYVFLEVWAMSGPLRYLTAGSAVHTELLFCPKTNFHGESRRHIEVLQELWSARQRATHQGIMQSPTEAIDLAGWWESQDVNCRSIAFGGSLNAADEVSAYDTGSGQYYGWRKLRDSTCDMPMANATTAKKYFYGDASIGVVELKKEMNECRDQWRRIDYYVTGGNFKSNSTGDYDFTGGDKTIKNNCNSHSAWALQCALKKPLFDSLDGKLTGLRPFASKLSEMPEEMCRCTQTPRVLTDNEWSGLERATWLASKEVGLGRAWARNLVHGPCTSGAQVHRYKGKSTFDKCTSSFRDFVDSTSEVFNALESSPSQGQLTEPRACKVGATLFCPHEDLHGRCCCPDNELTVTQNTFSKQKFCQAS